MITLFTKQEGYTYTPSYDCIYEYMPSKTLTKVVYAEVDYLDKDRIGVRVDRFEINRVDYFVHVWYSRTESGWQVEPSTSMWRAGTFDINAKLEYKEKAESVLLELIKEVAEKYSEPLIQAELIQAEFRYKQAVKEFEEAQEALKLADAAASAAFERYSAALSAAMPKITGE